MAKTVECPGCDRMFISNSAMVLHLEAGTCPSGVDRNTVDDIGIACSYYENYVSDNPNFDFQCPNCEAKFVLMSALLQHAESVDGCDAELETYGTLLRFLNYLEMHVRYYM